MPKPDKPTVKPVVTPVKPVKPPVKPKEPLAPDKIPLKPMQAARLAKIAGVKAEVVLGRTVVDILGEHRWKIDPKYLAFRKICGRVVKKDPATGKEFPVPFATVHVMDTDCHFMCYSPPGWPYIWHFPFGCKKEEVATVQTDACGDFCVWIPAWEIDWILYWRLIHVCYPIIFKKPSIRDILADPRFDRYREVVQPRIPRPPEPDPGPWVELRAGGMPLKITTDLLGRRTAMKLTALQASAQFGRKMEDMNKVMDEPAFEQAVPPPISTETWIRKEGGIDKAGLAKELNLDVRMIDPIDLHHFIGPFMRCVTMVMPEWHAIKDVPDITFDVTQDVNGDGVEEVIYTEGFFDVRWNSGSIPDIKLVASQIALAGVACEAPPVACSEQAIVLAGKHPLHNPPGAGADPYMNIPSGYAVRTNRPHPTGAYDAVVAGETALSPFCGTFPFYGCNHKAGKPFYRLLYQYQAPGSATFTTPAVPFLGFTWPLYRWVGHLEKLIVAPDSQGWYNVLPTADGWMPEHLLLNWPSSAFQDGLYKIKMELADAAKTSIWTSGEVLVRIDNTIPGSAMPTPYTKLRWRELPAGPWTVLDSPDELVCPVMARHAGKDLEFEVTYQVAHPHYRSLELYATGCGGGSMVRTSPEISARRWHTGPGITTDSSVAVFKLPAAALQGAYAFHLRVDTRAFNPDDAGGFGADWYADLLYRWTHFDLQIAVVNV